MAPDYREVTPGANAMTRVEKTVFLSYRRSNFPWALAVFQNLTQHGFDVFFDYLGIASGDFEQVILENIRSRAHFLVLLTPSALKRCGEPDDWLRREIEEALDCRRNIVPMMLESFDFGAPSISPQLVGKLALLKRYNGLGVPSEYFDAAMAKLRMTFLNVTLDAVLHPLTEVARSAAEAQRTAASIAPPVKAAALTAQDWFERGCRAVDYDEKIRCFDEAIRISPDDAVAYSNRGSARHGKGDLGGALGDFEVAIRLSPDLAEAYHQRGAVRSERDDFDGALQDFGAAIRLEPDYAKAYLNRGVVRREKGDLDGAEEDFAAARRLQEARK
jgi:tetratricopeptide (TPR) repeat protein